MRSIVLGFLIQRSGEVCIDIIIARWKGFYEVFSMEFCITSKYNIPRCLVFLALDDGLGVLLNVLVDFLNMLLCVTIALLRDVCKRLCSTHSHY